MRINWTNVTGLVVILLLIASSHWIVPPDVVPVGVDRLGDIGRSHQVGEWNKHAKTPWFNYVLMAELGVIVLMWLFVFIFYRDDSKNGRNKDKTV